MILVDELSADPEQLESLNNSKSILLFNGNELIFTSGTGFTPEFPSGVFIEGSSKLKTSSLDSQPRSSLISKECCIRSGVEVWL